MKSCQLASGIFLLLDSALSAVINDQLGHVQLIYQNDLLSNTTSTSAILIQSKKCYSDAVTACSTLSESLLAEVPADVPHQLNYLVYSRQIHRSDKIYIRGFNDSCLAYHVAEHKVVKVDCSTPLRVLCTQSAAPYSASQLNNTIQENRKVTVKSQNYSVTGYRDARSFRFLGIPFAQPPVGSLRFSPPLQYNGSTTINALHRKKACIQAPTPFGISSMSQSSEDCLTLSIFTPYIPVYNAPPATKKPVMVYFFGGSYEEGWADLPDYDGGNLASRGDVILVAVNYRVGILGFLATNITLRGNQGLQDQILSLQWIQQHIADFGGDPTRVTIFGQSAGAQSIVAHLSSSASKGLFSAAISQSALLGVPFVTHNVNSKYIAPAVANVTNCTASSEAATIACLRALPADEFVSAAVIDFMIKTAAVVYGAFDGVSQGLASAEPYLPVTAASGGPHGVIDDQFQYLLGNNSIPNPVPFMVGTMRNEAGLFLPLAPGFDSPFPTAEKVYEGVLDSGAIVPNDTAAAVLKSGLFPLNTSNPDGVRDLAGDILTSYAWQCPWQEVYSIAAANKIFPHLYTYIFDKGVPQSTTAPPRCVPGNSLGQQICHTTDISEVFGFSNIEGNLYNTTNSLIFTQYVMDTWISFARTHDPQPSQQYLVARGPAYKSTLHISAQSPFLPYASAKNGSIHHFDLPPSNSGPVYPERCKVYETGGGYVYNRINNAF